MLRQTQLLEMANDKSYSSFPERKGIIKENICISKDESKSLGLLVHGS